MSMLLDKRIVEEVGEYCPDQFLAYHRCLAMRQQQKQNQDEPGETLSCLELQNDLYKCVSTKVPSYLKIINNCSLQMKQFENCLRENPQTPSKCFDLQRDLRSCSEKALGV